MMTFRNHRLENHPLSGGTLWLLTDIAELKGKTEMAQRAAPEALERLRESAIVHSAESSNRIEGVEVAPDRLVPLILQNAAPRTRPEEELQGYRRALDLIHTTPRQLPISAETILRLHAIAQEGAGDAGQYKARDNEILEFPKDGGPPRVRFVPTPAGETPAAIAELCRWYTNAVDQRKVQPLVAIAALVLDFLCIHPFRDGNGRVARLLALLAMYHFDYDVGRYVSIERLIEESRDDYYQNLHASSQGWDEAKHDLGPWLNYFLVILRRAYSELMQKSAE